MFLIGEDLCWSASDVTAAAECEYAVLRRLDYLLKRESRPNFPEDPLMTHIARLGDQHEAGLLAEREASGRVVHFEHLDRPYSVTSLEVAHRETLDAFHTEPDVVYQATFFDGEFFGYADFIERSTHGWVVCDAKLARSAKPRALLQLGAYADQVRRMGLLLAPSVSLLLGNGERVDFPVCDVVPVFEERRARLRQLLQAHRAGSTSVAWGTDGVLACGGCPECARAAVDANDVILVAGVRMDQRKRLRSSGLTTVAEFAAATVRPDGMAQQTFDKLRAQAALQWKQMENGADAPVEYQLLDSAPATLALLPAPSPADIFFDFEGDPLYDEGDPTRVGLEYLWGLMGEDGAYQAFWAHDSDEERAAFESFMDLVASRRAHHPDMHIFHYAPYETTALKRLAMRYQTREAQLDDLLRSGVFVDLYATVRGSVRVSAPSYSIKKLEPLYMSDELRNEEGVQAGDASILAYHEFRELRSTNSVDAQARLDDLEEYNTYDCLSTLRLRDWLLQRAEEVGVRDQIRARAHNVADEEASAPDPLFLQLLARSGSERRNERNADEQAYAMLAAGLDYHRREDKQFWWGHYDRLAHPLDDWADTTRDVFRVSRAQVEADWAVPGGRARNERRTLRLIGDWAPGSKAGEACLAVYATPVPSGVEAPDGSPYGVGSVVSVAADVSDPQVLHLTEGRKPGQTFADVPVALVPAAPPNATMIAEAIREVGEEAASADSLPQRAALDILARRLPRLRGGVSLPVAGDAITSVVSALTGMDNSYVAIQGPPGTGKTYTGSRVIKELVEQHHWRIGVVAQSHAVVENMLGSILGAGLDPGLVGKSKNETPDFGWTDIPNVVGERAAFLSDHAESGCVLGGTAWTFTHTDLIERGGLDLLVIDEAGQFSLAPTIGASVCANRLLLLGDPQQLPQVSQGAHPEPVDESALGWLMGEHDTIPTEYGYFLGQSFRMHPALCEKVSVLSYEGRLLAAPPASERHLGGVAPGLHVVRVDHKENRTASPEEAAEVVTQIRDLLGAQWRNPSETDAARPLGLQDFLVVAPYNAQVALIRAELEKAGLSGVRVGTVDKFQGQQAPVAIVSMTASSHGDVPRGMGFLLSRNRINVAVSRAQWLAILVRSEALTSYMPSSVDGLLELGAFIGLGQAEAQRDALVPGPSGDNAN